MPEKEITKLRRQRVHAQLSKLEPLVANYHANLARIEARINVLDPQPWLPSRNRHRLRKAGGAFPDEPGRVFPRHGAKATAGELNLARTIWGLRTAAAPKPPGAADGAGGLRPSQRSWN